MTTLSGLEIARRCGWQFVSLTDDGRLNDTGPTGKHRAHVWTQRAAAQRAANRGLRVVEVATGERI